MEALYHFRLPFLRTVLTRGNEYSYLKHFCSFVDFDITESAYT